MEEYQSTHVPIRSKTMALGTAGDLDTADILMDVSFQVSREGKSIQLLPTRSRDMVGQINRADQDFDISVSAYPRPDIRRLISDSI